MSGFDLLKNYTNNSEVLLRKNRSCTTSSATLSVVELVTPVPSATTDMAKSLCDYSTPAVANMPVGPAVNTGTGNFELRTGKPIMWFAKRGCKCSLATLPRAVRHHRLQKRRTS